MKKIGKESNPPFGGLLRLIGIGNKGDSKDRGY
jgi:hypothetical protein